MTCSRISNSSDSLISANCRLSVQFGLNSRNSPCSQYSMHKLKFVSHIFVLLVLSLSYHDNVAAGSFTLQQALFDGVNGVDGLDNPRQVKLSPDGRYVWVTSSDDNSLLILELEGLLTPLQIFKDEKAADSVAELKLEGANGLALFNNGKSAVVASFYDGALSSFKKGKNSKFTSSGIITDNLSHERVFRSNEPLSNEDELGILGAWGIHVSPDEKQLFVASYKSDAIAIFDIDEDSRLAFNSKISSHDLSPNALGKPVNLVYSELNNELVVAGYESNMITVFSRDEHGKLTLKQTINNSDNAVKHLVNPQYMVLSSDNKFVYIACSGSNAILVFERTEEKYVFTQSVTQSETGGSGLAGVASMALSSDGSQLYAAGEFDKGMLRFDIGADGRLNYKEKIQIEGNEIEGVTSIATSEDGKFILLSLGKKDALYLLKQN